MGGLYSALNISKNAMLAFQTAVNVTSHNVANVDTEGYSRQEVVNTTYPPTPSVIGPLGSGVKIDEIKRYFDAFLENNLNLKRSDLGLFEAEETGLSMIEGIFNETNEDGLASILSDFFSAWEGLADRPEGIPERRVVTEKGEVLANTISQKYQDLVSLQKNIQLEIEDVVNEINSLAKQIAELNLQITAAESGMQQANDLRDQRDLLVSKLSQLVEISYFENNQGAYSVVLGNGYNLVDIDNHWQLEMSGGEVYWVGNTGEKIRLTSADVGSGKLGGWLRIEEQISEDWNHEYVISRRSVYEANGNYIREDSTWEDLGFTSSFTIDFSGTNHWGEEIHGTYSWDPSSDSGATVRDFLDSIERAFDYTVQAYLSEDGRLIIKDAYRGSGSLNFQIDSGSLDFGTFDDEGANHRVEELNLTGKFQLFGEELIRTINEIHSQGVGLDFYNGELEGTYEAAGDGKLKALPFFTDIDRKGSFFLWVKDSRGSTTPIKVNLTLPIDATIQDVADQINQALIDQGFDPENSIKASFRDGHLVFQAQEGWSFAFSNDTSNILLATGINVFFTGWDAGSIALNQQLSTNPEKLAAGRLDYQTWTSETPLFASYRSRLTVDPSQVEFPGPVDVVVRFYDQNGNLVLHETEDGYKTAEIRGPLDEIPGLSAYIDTEGHYVIELAPNMDNNYAYFEIGLIDPVPENNFLDFLREAGMNIPLYAASYGRQESDSYFADPASISLNEGGNDLTLTFTFYDYEGQKTGEKSITLSDGISLKELAQELDSLPELAAGFSEGDKGKFYIRMDDPPEGTDHFSLSVTGGNNNGVIDLTDGSSDFSLSLNSKEDRQIASGLEYFLQPKRYEAQLEGRDASQLLFEGDLKLKFFDSSGYELSSLSLSSSSLTDSNANGIIDLEDLVEALNSQTGIEAYIDNGDLVIQMDDNAPQGSAYFVIQGNGQGAPWGQIKLTDLHEATSSYDDEPFYLAFNMGNIDNWLFDEAGNPIDTDTNNDYIDPFRIELSSDEGAIQLIKKYNEAANAKYGLKARIDPQGKLVVETSGLYNTNSFLITDGNWQEESTVYAEKFSLDNDSYFYLSDKPVNLNDTFSPQTINISYIKNDGSLDVVSIDFTSDFTLSDFIDQINLLDEDGDGLADFNAYLDDSNRLVISINDVDQDNDEINDFLRFSIESSLGSGQGNLVTYLARHREKQQSGLINFLQGPDLRDGDNRNALKLANATEEQRSNLGQSTLGDYYSSLVGEIGIASQSVQQNKDFFSDLVTQLQTMRDSVSAVSLDEEMTNLIKYQQAFAASARILTIVDEMLDTLIAAKR